MKKESEACGFASKTGWLRFPARPLCKDAREGQGTEACGRDNLKNVAWNFDKFERAKR